MPKISIISPVFNNEKTLEETICSVREQSFADWEHIFVDDGSTDASEDIILQYVKKDNRIKYLKRERSPKGGSVCRNIGVEEATGEYVMFLDSDDLLLKGCLLNRLLEIDNTKLDFVVHPMASFYEDSSESTAPTLIFTKNPLYLFASSTPAWQITSPLFRRSFFLSLNGFDETYYRLQDIEFHFRAISSSNGNYKVFPADVDCLYRLSPKGYSKNKLLSTISMYNKFITLVEEKFLEGVLMNRKKLVISQLLLFSNLSLILYALKTNGAESSEMIFESEILHKQLPFLVKWIPHFLTSNGGLIKTNLQFLSAYFISRNLKSYFIRSE